MAYSIAKSSRWGCVFAGTAVLLALWVAVAFMTGQLPFQFFDSQSWKQAESSDGYPRLRMIEPLRLSGRLDGITRAEVVALLGPSDDTDYFSHWDFVYWLGPQRSLLGLDSEWLVVRIGPTGRVAEYDVLSD